ncbi:uncharacterized protein LOC127731037 isoform X1 [Mytilus californianus]|uniref:uncharacterized protein LOC127731037 isoform X1 n=1 Tax=Mytilus californianus TaxID=6549 RepID=UPI002246B18C|nr:uncharacterized protein LOC127731037 isoform X1 [Mytilus californianus]
MNMLTFVFSLVGFLMLLQNTVSGLSRFGSNVCSVQVCTWRWEYRCAYRTWSGACCYYRRVQVQYYRTDYFCCRGWKSDDYTNCNVAICNPSCLNSGTCTEPNVCLCRDAYEGPICGGVGQCSYLKPCYPGSCYGTSNCMCADGFAGEGCRTFANETLTPAINRCNATFTYHNHAKDMDIYTYFGDATQLDEPFELWSNQRDFNIIEMTMEAIYDTNYNIPIELPPIPDYVSSMELGITAAKVKTKHTKISGSLTYEEEYICPEPKPANPVLNSVLTCTLKGTNDIRVDSGDIFSLTFSATSGGYVKYLDRDTNQIKSTLYYTGKTRENFIDFKFDYEVPVHCISDSTPCLDKSPLRLDEDITQKPITPHWDGWYDELSGILRYSVELWRMEYSEENMHLREPLITDTTNPVPDYMQEVNFTTPLQFPTFDPSKPGVYSCILEVSDKANNTQYARRFVIFDKTSQVTTRNNNPLYCSSASESANFTWQTSINDDNGQTRINITWKDHFVNQVHEEGHFLSPVSSYEPRLTDGGRRIDYKKIDPAFDDNEGSRTRNAISNLNSIVLFEFAHQIPPVIMNSLTWENLSLTQNWSLTVANIRDGDSRQFFVRATDIMGRQTIDSTTIHFDSTPPSIFESTLSYNIGDGQYKFSSRFTIKANDQDSGVPTVKIRIVTKSGIEKYKHEYKNPVVLDTSTCPSCYKDRIGNSYSASMSFDINNCWMGVGIEETNTEMHTLEIGAYNGAMLAAMQIENIADVKSLKGIQQYFGVQNLTITSISDTSFQLKWVQPETCYQLLGLKLMVSDGQNRTTEHKIFKSARTVYVGNLNPSTSYTFQMFTKYGPNEDNFGMSDPVGSSFSTAAKRESSLSPGGIAGIVVGFLLLIVIFIIILILLHRTGRLTKAKEQVNTGFTKIRNTIKLRDPETKSGYNNRAYSGVNEDEYYIEGGIQISTSLAPLSRKSISLESEITRGRFAIIYKAIYYGNNKDAETVVAKTLKDQAIGDDLKKMRTKINFYATKVGHDKHVLDFKGFVEDDVRGPFMVLEFCENGSLKDYLRENKSRVNDDMTERLYRISYGTCMGMDYLASNGIVHRRLAARNILLNFLLEPKITGFGPDPDADKDNDDSSERIPVKWMAPECMSSTKKATEKSDVWSYGIVLWEIFSMGETPYPDIKGPRLPDWLKQNNRMAKPEYCDDTFYKMMKKCWQYEPNKRPNFKKLNTDLAKMFSEGPDEEYYYRSSRIYDNRT